MTAQKQFEIVDGPSREALFDALRLRHMGCFHVTFQISTPNGDSRIKVRVNSIGIEDGSGNNWLIEVYDPQGILGDKYLHGYYRSCAPREGYLKLGPTPRA